MSAMNVLVTGGAGFIGSHLVDELVARAHAVAVLDNLDPQVHGAATKTPPHLVSHIANGPVRFRFGDVTDPEALKASLEGVEAVVHLAAVVGVGQSMYKPYYYVHTNATGTGLLLDFVARNPKPIPKLVVASSMSLYGEGAYRCPACGGSTGEERSEEQLAASRWEIVCTGCGSDMEPVGTRETKVPVIASVYAATKRHQEDLFVSFGRAYRIPTFALRFFNVFGRRQSLGNPYTGVAAIFLSRLLNGRPPLIFEDGGQSRDFIDVRDVAAALVKATEFQGHGTHVLNVGTGRRTSVAGVAQALSSHPGLDLKPQILGKYRAGDIRHCVTDTLEARRVLGFQARYALDEGIPDLIDWCRNEQPPNGVEASFAELTKKGLVR
jgi:dTDP-L-rhamnose 4-epimerase